MNIDQTISDLSVLPVEHRLRIVQELWDSIPADAEMAVSAEQAEELNRRSAARLRFAKPPISNQPKQARETPACPPRFTESIPRFFISRSNVAMISLGGGGIGGAGGMFIS